MLNKKKLHSEIQNLTEKHRNELERERTSLILERERFISVLRKPDEELFEYHPSSDTMVSFRFCKGEDGQFERVKHLDYMSGVLNGQVCHPDDIPVMIAFLEGSKTDCFTVRMKSDYEEGGFIWSEIIGEPVFNEDGSLKLITAVSRNVTDIKIAELEKLDRDKYDIVTKFYNIEYGETQLHKAIAERGARQFCFARILISNSSLIRSKYGNFYYDAILEEISAIMRKGLETGDIVLRSAIDEFFMLKKDITIKKAAVYFENLRQAIEVTHADGESYTPLRCCIGVSTSDYGDERSLIRYCTGLALCASSAGASRFGSVIFYKDVIGNKEAKAAYEQLKLQSKGRKPSEGGKFSSGSGYDPDETITSFALNIFEKTNGFSRAMRVFLSKAGKTLNMKRIIIYDINPGFMHINVMYKWYAEGYEIERPVIDTDKGELNRVKALFEESGYITADKHFIDPSNPVLSEMINVVNNGVSLIFPMYDKNDYIGNIVYETSAEAVSAADLICLKELSKIIGAYISKSKTSHESRAKSEFLSRMSHEIRTPMNAIMGMTYLALQSGEASSHIEDCLKKIDSSSHYLLTLINDILDMARIESGKITLEETYFNLNNLIIQLEDMIRVQADKKGLQFNLKKSTETVHLMGDPLKLNQVLINILGNAVKFTEKGSIDFSVTQPQRSEEDEAGTAAVMFSVKDTGIGISCSALKRIFNTFEQATGDTARKYGGTGLGLSIADSLIEMMGGKLEAESEIGEGTEFRFTLKFKKAKGIPEDEAAKETSPSNEKVEMKGRKILVAEDDDLNFEIVDGLLRPDGIICERAEDGKIAVEMFKSSEINYYDAIFMDIRMPVMNGLEATKVIRGLDREDAAAVPIIAMSANAFEADVRKSLESGMNAHCSKPIDIRKIRIMLNDIWKGG